MVESGREEVQVLYLKVVLICRQALGRGESEVKLGRNLRLHFLLTWP